MIRSFTADDLHTVTDIWLAANTQAHHFIPKQYWMENIPYVKKMFPLAQLYVFEQSGIINGFIGLSGNNIKGIFVRPGAQSQGIGTQLLNKAKQLNSTLRLTVYKKNIRAAAFYKRNGFRILKESADPSTNQAELTMEWNTTKRI